MNRLADMVVVIIAIAILMAKITICIVSLLLAIAVARQTYWVWTHYQQHTPNGRSYLDGKAGWPASPNAIEIDRRSSFDDSHRPRAP